MQSYLRRARLSTAADAVGLRLIIMLAGTGWFVYLWGLTVPALLAGAALGMLGQLGLNSYRRRTVDRREAALRRAIGGEMMLEEILLAPPRQAHFQTALLLGERYPLAMERVTQDGMLCRSGEERLLVQCVAIPPEDEVGRGTIAALQRACRVHDAVRGVACVTGRTSRRVEAWAGEGVIPVRIIRREMLLELAGYACPATDEQLIRLGKRRKRLASAGVLSTVLRRDKARTYWLYGVGLLMLYLLTGLGYYPLAGIMCLLLAAGSRCVRQGRERL